MTDLEILEKYKEAEVAVLEGKNISFRGETFGLEDLDKIRAGRREYERKVYGRGKPYSLASFS